MLSKMILPRLFCTIINPLSNSSVNSSRLVKTVQNVVQLSDDLKNHQDGQKILESMSVHPDFITKEEENHLLEEVEPYMRRLKYEFDHWDDAIHGFRETERLEWNEKNTLILNRVRDLAFPPSVALLRHVHVLDLAENGYIKPHIDGVRHCGDTIAGLSLLSDCVMRLVCEKETNLYADVILRRRSLYVMNGAARYRYTHEILANEKSVFQGSHVRKERRISVICRNEPNASDN